MYEIEKNLQKNEMREETDVKGQGKKAEFRNDV